jgi:dipeptidyl aminopeptidase/acylaminoacyl peptidase
MGWLDNDRIALDAGQFLVATRDGTSFQYRNFHNLTGRDNLFMIQLLPDRKTMFAWVNDDFYLRDVHSGDIRKVGKRSQAKDARYGIIQASPNGQYISYVGPDVQSGGTSGPQLNLSFQRFSDDSRHLLVPGGVWDPRPAWSPDSSRIALVRTTTVPAGNNASIFESEKADTDIYVATIDDLQVRRLTSFSGDHNRGIQWTPGGNLLVASTYGSRNKAFGLVSVSTTDGSATRLWTPPPGETFALSTLFESQPSGMPPAGVDPGRP